MPVDTGLNKEGMIYQRDQYAKGGIGARYRDYLDTPEKALTEIRRVLRPFCLNHAVIAEKRNDVATP